MLPLEGMLSPKKWFLRSHVTFKQQIHLLHQSACTYLVLRVSNLNTSPWTISGLHLCCSTSPRTVERRTLGSDDFYLIGERDGIWKVASKQTKDTTKYKIMCIYIYVYMRVVTICAYILDKQKHYNNMWSLTNKLNIIQICNASGALYWNLRRCLVLKPPRKVIVHGSWNKN